MIRAAFGPDAAAVLLDDAAAEREAEAGAAEGAGVGGVALLEALEDAFQFFRGDAAALILDAKADFGDAAGPRPRRGRCAQWLRGQADGGVPGAKT